MRIFPGSVVSREMNLKTHEDQRAEQQKMQQRFAQKASEGRVSRVECRERRTRLSFSLVPRHSSLDNCFVLFHFRFILSIELVKIPMISSSKISRCCDHVLISQCLIRS